ncbi:hypothetical protein BDN67DRAFT_1048611 [Paxillus ammoniavirescens]|nr:hypothetical protein BDN67DRAFT_1048611 [Paxillus ammoniavirescens]
MEMPKRVCFARTALQNLRRWAKKAKGLTMKESDKENMSNDHMAKVSGTYKQPKCDPSLSGLYSTTSQPRHDKTSVPAMNPTLFSSHTHDPGLVNINVEGPGYDGDQNRDGLSEVDSSDSDSSDEDDGSPSQFKSSWPGHSGSSIYKPNEGFEGFEVYAQAVIQVEDKPLSREVNAHEPASTAAPIPILPTLHHSTNFHRPPSVEDARLAMKDINTLLHPPHSKGRGLSWSSAALQTVQFVGKGPYMSCKVWEWSKAYIADCENLPVIKYGGAWTKSCIDDEDLKQELLLHLQMLGKYVTASAIVTFLAHLDVQARYQLMKTVSLATAQHWMKHNTFIPEWYKLDPKTRKWSSVNPDEQEGGQEGEEGRRTVVWHHDKSTFYAHNCCKTCWVPKGEKVVPQQKGEGTSLMVADIVSADYGWLCSHDGKESARVLFRAGKGRDGYFTNDDIIAHAEKAMVILEKDYADEDHIFIFDNATTHLKRADDALSARHMPKSCRAWGVERNKKDAEEKAVYSADGKLVKEKIPMKNGTFVDGSPQNFYYPPDHLSAGLFKGMAKVLEERGFTVSGLKAHALDAVPLMTMQRFAIRSRHFIDAYHKGLNGAQAAWAARKYQGHRVLPSTLMADLDIAKAKEGLIA